MVLKGVKMSEMLYIPFLVLFVLIILGVIVTYFAWKNRKQGNDVETDYCSFFILGIGFLPVGVVLSIATENPGLAGISALGAIYMAIGLNNRDKWKKVD